MRRRVVIAPDSYKGTLSAVAAAAALADGWRTVRPGDEIVTIPLADGGEGTLDAIQAAVPAASRRSRRVTGPDGRPVDARWLLLPDGTAVVELAQSSGLPLMARPDPLRATTYGLGEVLAAASSDARRVVVGLGGSATTDGASGALTALGARLSDRAGRSLEWGGAALASLAEIDLSGLLPPPSGGVECLVDVASPLLGPAGAAAVFGPQKGASPEQVAELEAALVRWAALMGGDPQAPGAGAAGGAAYGLSVGWGASLRPGAREMTELSGLNDVLAGADLLITGEGRFDATSLHGKLVGHLYGLARASAVPMVVVAGAVAAPTDAEGLSAVSLTELAGSSGAARADPARYLRAAGAQVADTLGQDHR